MGRGNTVVEDVVDVGLNYGSGGLVGYENGEIRAGSTLHMLDEGIGEVTGRNMIREQMARAEARMLDENAKREQLLQDQQTQTMNLDLLRSRSAANRGSGAGGRGRSSLAMGSAAMGEEEQDFLGL